MESTDRARRSLKDLAEAPERAPARPRSVATPDSSGFVDIAALTAASPSLVDDLLLRAKTRNAVDIREAPVTTPLDPIDDEELFASVRPQKKGRGKAIAMAIIAMAAVGAAAMGAVRLKQRLAPTPAPIVVSAPPVVPPPPTLPNIPPPPPEPVAAQAPSDPQAEAPAADAKPEAKNDTTAPPKEAKPAVSKRGAHAHAARTQPAPKLAAAIAAKVPAPPPAPASNSFTDAIKQASGATLPDRPPAPAVTTALRSAQASARGCLGANDPPMRAVVTFASSGSVSSVQASGPGASCVQTAFSRAKVPAFAQPSYTAAVTVRPN